MEILHKKYNLFQKERSSSRSKNVSKSRSSSQNQEVSPQPGPGQTLKSTLKVTKKDSDDFFGQSREKSVSFNQANLKSETKIAVGDLKASDSSSRNEEHEQFFNVRRKRAYTEQDPLHGYKNTLSNSPL